MRRQGSTINARRFAPVKSGTLSRFDEVQDFALPDGDDTKADEYKIEPKQMSCPMFVDIEADTKARAEITTSACASACKLSSRAVMLLKAN